jgi:hypothetical protein
MPTVCKKHTKDEFDISQKNTRRSKAHRTTPALRMKRPANQGPETTIFDQHDGEGEASSRRNSTNVDRMLEERTDKTIKSEGTVSLSSEEEPDPDAVAAMIANELKNLSFDERTAACEDVHGVAAPAEEETPEAIAAWMEEFREVMRKNRNSQEYEKAVFLNPDYVTDEAVVMMFLRAEDYNVKKAVVRMIKHYKHKLEIFGIDKLAKPLTFDDLDEDDQEAAWTGFYQKLALPDQSGRPILLVFPHLMNFKTVQNQVKNIFVPFVLCVLAPPFLCFSSLSLSSSLPSISFDNRFARFGTLLWQPSKTTRRHKRRVSSA